MSDTNNSSPHGSNGWDFAVSATKLPARKLFWLCLFGFLAWALVELKGGPLETQILLASGFLVTLVLDMISEKWGAPARVAEQPPSTEAQAVPATVASVLAVPITAEAAPESSLPEEAPVTLPAPPKSVTRPTRRNDARSFAQEPCITPAASLPSAA
jgi:hypothetical protein